MTGGEKYLKGKAIPEELISVQRDGFIESYILSFLLNDYHQAKSKEEAGLTDQDKIKMYMKRYPNIMMHGFSGADLRQAYFSGIDDTLAAFGKDGEG